MRKPKWAVALLFLCLGCQENIVYHSYQPIPSSGWLKGDTLFYSLPADLPAGEYSLYVGVRHRESYTYRDLWLSVDQTKTDSLSFCHQTDSLHLYLASPKGSWRGHGIGGTRQYLSKSAIPVDIKEGQQCVVKIAHAMKDQPLFEIDDIGIKLEKRE